MTSSVFAARRAVFALVALFFASSATAAPWDTDWTLRAELTASDGAGSDYLGRSVSLDGDTAVVGAAGADINGAESQGAAYVFVGDGVGWSQQAKLVPSGLSSGDISLILPPHGLTASRPLEFCVLTEVERPAAARAFAASERLEASFLRYSPAFFSASAR